MKPRTLDGTSESQISLNNGNKGKVKVALTHL